MRLAVLGFLLGVVWLQQQPSLPRVHWWPLAALVLGVAILFRQRSRGIVLNGIRIGSALFAALALGVAWSTWRAEQQLANTLPTTWESRDIVVEGFVANLPQENERGIRFEFIVERVHTEGATAPSRVLLSWYDEVNRKTDEVRTPPQLVPGDRWRLTVRLRQPHGTQNPHAFDFEAWALERGIRATGYVRPARGDESHVQLPTPAAGFWVWVDRARWQLRATMQAALGDSPYQGVLVALGIGQQSAIPAEQWRVFTRTGTGHLMSISGLHITMIASLGFWLAFRLWARIPRMPLWLPAPRAAALAGAFTAFVYAVIAGFSVPTQRTFYMLSAVAVALWFGHRLSGSRILAAALILVVLIDPWAILSAGFWLSFGAVAMIFYVTERRSGNLSAANSAIRTQIAVTLGLVPLTLVLFQEVSLISPIANAFAIPVVSLIVVPLTLLGVVVSETIGVNFLLASAHFVMSLCYDALAWLAQLNHVVWQSHEPSLWAASLALIAVLWLLAPRGIPARAAALVLLLPLFLSRPSGPIDGALRVHVLDVGQGLAHVVRTAHHTLVYDTGPRWNPDADSGNRIIVPFLRGEGITKLDALIVTHADDDHSGGAKSVIDARNPAWVMTSMPLAHEYFSNAVETMRCEVGDAWHWDGVDFEILHPTTEDYARGDLKTNDMGCVLKISAPGGSILLTADIEARSETALRLRDAASLKADVLVVPHHGSKTSSTDAFLDAVAPTISVLSLGYRNRFRHPHPTVETRYRDKHMRLERTDTGGALTLDFIQGQPIRLERFRESARRYWWSMPVAPKSSTED